MDGFFSPGGVSRRLRAALGASAVMLGVVLAPAVVLANPPGAPAQPVGGTIASAAQTSAPNLGQAFVQPAASRQAVDNTVLAGLGLTPPGNTPAPCLSCTGIVWGD